MLTEILKHPRRRDDYFIELGLGDAFSTRQLHFTGHLSGELSAGVNGGSFGT
jgi:hypothetical protein